jgi:hypothetical protein
LILEGVVSRRDLETHYSIDDMQDDLDALDAMAEARHEAERRAEQKRNKGR